MQSKNAIGNLINRYKAVLKKCHLMNIFGSLAVATALLLSPVMAENAFAVTIVNADGGKGGATNGGSDGEGKTNTNGVESFNGNDGSVGSAASAASGGSGGTGYGGALGGGAGTSTSGGGGGGGGLAEVRGASDGGEAFADGGAGNDEAGFLGGGGGGGGTAIANGNTNANGFGGQAQANGGNAYGGGNGGDGGTAYASSNTVRINSNNTIFTGGFALTSGGFGNKGGKGGTALAQENTIKVEGGDIDFIYGGYARSLAGESQGAGQDGQEGGKASVVENNVLIESTGSTIKLAVGGQAMSLGGKSDNANGGNGSSELTEARLNIVTVENVQSLESVYGGIALNYGGLNSTNTIRGTAGQASASSNKIFINSGTITANIIGGLVFGNSARAESNEITLANAPNLANTHIWGAAMNTGNPSSTLSTGYTPEPVFASNANTFNGNTLHVNKYSGTGTITSMGNFEKYNFILPSSTVAGVPVLKVTHLHLGNAFLMPSTKFAQIASVSIEDGHNLPLNSTVILIDAVNLSGTLANDGATVTSDVSTFTEQLWQINQDNINNDITATYVEKKLTPTPSGSLAGTLVETHTNATTAILSSSASTIVTAAIPASQMATRNASNQRASLENMGMSAGSASSQYNSFAPFAVVQGGYSSFDSGIDTEVTSISFVGGLAHKSYFNASELLVGAFIETGLGSYNSTVNSSGNSIDSDGSLSYFGGGLFARYDWYTKNGLPYIEASARLGSLNTDFDSDDIRNITTGSNVNYETNSMYYGLHIGAGYVWNINTEWALDMSAKYFWTHQESIDKEIAGDNFNFDAIDSHIVRVGATLSYEMRNNERYSFSPYVGLHYEHEFDSEARASVENLSIANSANLEGGTTVLSLGTNFVHVNGFSLNAKAEGSLGERDGVKGLVEMTYTF